jgi:hypothetical protein
MALRSKDLTLRFRRKKKDSWFNWLPIIIMAVAVEWSQGPHADGVQVQVYAAILKQYF